MRLRKIRERSSEGRLAYGATPEATALIQELLDAHLDTIEIMSASELMSDHELSHVGYLKALYRHGQGAVANRSSRTLTDA